MLLDHNGVIREANPVTMHIFGFPARQLRGQSMDVFLCEGSKLPQPHEGSAKGEVEIATKWGERKQLIAYANELVTEGKGLIYLMLQDITESKATERKIAYMAYHDPLTGLGNRLMFQEKLKQLLIPAIPVRSRGALLLLDLDRFKEVNDGQGQQAGDKLLFAISGKLKEIVPDHAVLARIDGDEFALLLPDVAEIGDAETIGRRIVAAVSEPGDHASTVSIGIALWPDHEEHAESLYVKADRALNQVKQQGGNGLRVWSAE